MPRGRLLVVDDEPDVLESTVLLLRAEGYDADGLTRWQDAEEAIARQPYDALLQDVHMPALDLATHVARMRAIDGRMVILLFTADIDAPAFERKARADGVLEKPFEVDRLVARLEQMRRIRAIV